MVPSFINVYRYMWLVNTFGILMFSVGMRTASQGVVYSCSIPQQKCRSLFVPSFVDGVLLAELSNYIKKKMASPCVPVGI